MIIILWLNKGGFLETSCWNESFFGKKSSNYVFSNTGGRIECYLDLTQNVIQKQIGMMIGRIERYLDLTFNEIIVTIAALKIGITMKSITNQRIYHLIFHKKYKTIEVIRRISSFFVKTNDIKYLNIAVTFCKNCKTISTI